MTREGGFGGVARMVARMDVISMEEFNASDRVWMSYRFAIEKGNWSEEERERESKLMPLLWVCRRGDASRACELLLETLRDPDAIADVNGISLWNEWSARQAQDPVRSYLAESAVRKESPEDEGPTGGWGPLHFASAGGHVDVVRVLLSVPWIDVNLREGFWGTPLLEASRRGHAEVVRVLLAAPGIAVNQVDALGVTPLLAAAKAGHVEVVRMLLAAPETDVNQEEAMGQTPLQAASENGHTEVVKLLLATPGIVTNHADSFGTTPLYAACSEGHADVMRLLLEHAEVDVNEENILGISPLSMASARDQVEVVQQLLAVPGIQVNQASRGGETAVHWAVTNGHAEAVRLLLSAPGVDVNKACDKGNTPLLAACLGARHAIARLLLAVPGVALGTASDPLAVLHAVRDGFIVDSESGAVRRVPRSHAEAGSDSEAEPLEDMDFDGGDGVDEEMAAEGDAGEMAAGYDAELVAEVEHLCVKRIAGPLTLAMMCGGIPRNVAAELSIHGLADDGLRARAREMMASRGPRAPTAP